MDAARAARAWAETWARAWPVKDLDAIEALYADDAVFRSAPFREPHEGRAGVRAYFEWAFADEEEIECRLGEPLVVGERATVEYWAALLEDGKEATLAGISVLRFRDDGLVAEQHDYWVYGDGRRRPPPGWGD